MRSLRALVRNDAPVPYTGKRSSSAFGGNAAGGAGSPSAQLTAMAGSGTLFAIIDALSTATSSVDWTLYRKPTDGKRVPDEEREPIPPHRHAAAALWAKPNDFFTTDQLVETVQQHFDLTGKGFLLVVKKAGIPIELWPARPDRMAPVPHPTKFLAGWVYTGPDGEKVPLDVDEVIALRKPDPLDVYGGMGAVAAIGTELDASKAASEWNAAFFRNSAEPGGILEVDKRLGDDEFNELRERWNEQHRGVSRAHRVAILEQAKWVDRKMTQRDMQFVELRHLGRDVTMEAFRISKTALGITDDVNRAAALAAEYQFSSHLTVPRLNRWKQILNARLLPMFGSPGKGVEFDYDSPVSEDADAENAERDSKVSAVVSLAGAGWSPVDAAKAYGLPDIQYGTGEAADPDRELMIKLVTAAPAALGPLLLPILLPNVEFPDSPDTAPAGPSGATTDPAPAPPGEDPETDDPEAGPEGSEEVPPGPDFAPGPGGTDNRASWDCAAGHPAGCVHVTDPNLPIRNADDDPPEADLTDHQAAWTAALDQLLVQWAIISAAQRRELAQQIAAAIDDDDLAALAALSADSATGAERLQEALAALAQVAATQAAAEAAAQGVTLPAEVPPPETLSVVAIAVASLLASSLAVAAGREALRRNDGQKTGAKVASEVVTFLAEQSDRPLRDQLGGALTGAQNQARIATFVGEVRPDEDGMAGPVGSIYADETLDENTCAPCRAINGRFIATTEDQTALYALYPPTGGYIDCLGGIRCRGTVTGTWRPKTTDGGQDT